MDQFSIRPSQLGDEALILQLLLELAEYEKLLEKFHVSEDVIRRDYLGAQPLLHCDLAFENGAPVGVATWYWKYSSFAAKRAIFLEDLFVRPKFRGKRYGKALRRHLARRALAVGAKNVEWSVLEWNKPSIDFYDSLGARPVEGWIVYGLEGEALHRLGEG